MMGHGAVRPSRILAWLLVLALALLATCPPELRDWEWGRLQYLCGLSERVLELGVLPNPQPAAPFRQLLIREVAFAEKLVKEAGIKVE